MVDKSQTNKELQQENMALRQRVAELEHLLHEQNSPGSPHNDPVEGTDDYSLYLSLVDNLPDALYRIDLEGRLTFVNKVLQESLQLPYSDILGKTAYDFYPPELAQKYRQDDARVIETHKPFRDVEININPADGKSSYVRVSKIPIYDDDGKVCGIQGFFQDITEQTQMQLDLENSQAILQRLIQQIPIGIQVFDIDGLCTDVNDTHLEIFGVERDDLVGKYNIFDDKLALRMTTVDAAQKALDGETVTIGDLEFDFSSADTRYVDVSQEPRVINVTIFPIFNHDKQVVGFVGLNIDVTERKAVESQLRISEERYRGIIEDQPEMIARFLPDGTYTFVNQAFCNFHGGTYADYIGNRWQDYTTDEIEEAGEESIAHANDNDTGIAEVLYDRRDGEKRWIQWINRAVKDEKGQTVEFQSTGIDITEKKKLEDQQFMLALEQERIKILGDFVVRAAHEFRTPLSIISSAAYAMTRLTDGEQLLERREKINKQVNHITRLINDMTLMSRIDTGTKEVAARRINLNILLEIVYTRAKSNLEFETRFCELDLADEALYVFVGQDDFTRAVEAICENAIRFTSENDSIRLQSRREGDHAIVNIIDTGTGIDGEDLPHIFERFYRSNYTGKTPGLGLGLSIAKALLRVYNATIDVESEVGKGTTFTIKLKLAPDISSS